jgi:phospho-2-dehydro-3-deoxyheptonate aldolase
MAKEAPPLPTTEQLQSDHQLEAEAEISLARERAGGILIGRESGLVGIIGPCSMNEQTNIIVKEGDQLRQLTEAEQGLYVAHRINPWKPRTRPEDWHGLETTEPELAFRTLVRQANEGAGVAIELATMRHAARYMGMLTLGWFGSRNVDGEDMMLAVATYDTELPVAVKNGLDGTIDSALMRASAVRDARGEDAAPAVLLYRGGENAKTPAAWERTYRDALERTGGHMIVDVAHGSEMAHDPNGGFKKSVPGQIAAMNHVIRIADEHEELPTGIMMEASSARSDTDPVMPFETATNGLLRLLDIQRR